MLFLLIFCFFAAWTVVSVTHNVHVGDANGSIILDYVDIRLSGRLVGKALETLFEQIAQIIDRIVPLEAFQVNQATENARLQSQIDAVLSELAAVTTRLTDAEADIDSLNAQVATMNTELVTTKDDLQTCLTDVGIATARVIFTEGEIDVLQADLISLNLVVATLNAELNTAKGDVQKCLTDVISATSQVESVEGAIGVLQADVSQSETDISELRTDVDGHIGHDTGDSSAIIVERVVANEVAIVALNEQFGTLDTDLTTVKDDLQTCLGCLADVNALTIKVTNAEGDIDVLQADVGSDLLGTGLFGKVSQSETDISELRTDVDGHIGHDIGDSSDIIPRVDALELAVSEVETDITIIDGKIADVTPEDTYERWGRTVCPAGDELVYKGMIAGSWYTVGGGTTSITCVRDNQVMYTTATSTQSYVYKAEVEPVTNSPYASLTQAEVACAVCKTRGKKTIVMHGVPITDNLGQPLAQDGPCPQGFKERYRGYSMSSHTGHGAPTKMVCIDNDLEFAGNTANHNGRLLYHVSSENNHVNGFNTCHYVDKCIWSCAVCTLE